MKLLNMTEWGEVCEVHRPIHVIAEPAAGGFYWRSSISEHYWKLIPAHWLTKQNGHMMAEFTLFEEMQRKK